MSFILCMLLSFNVIGESDSYKIDPFMINPFSPPNPVLWLICPTHQVKYIYN